MPYASRGVGLPLADVTASEEGPLLFSEVVSCQVKPAGRDDFTAALTVRVQPDTAAHPRSLLLELTDESDPLFYHSLVLGEGDYHSLKSEQRLLVDFQCFPAQLVELLRRCMDAQGTPAGTPLGGASLDAPRMLACLECSNSGESLFSIMESNQFRELTHLALRLRPGTDDAIKQHLAAKLRGFRAECSELAEKHRISEETLSQSQRQADELAARLRVISEERTHLERSLEATHQRELADLRQEHSRALAELQRVAAEERAQSEGELRRFLDEARGRASAAERANEELQQQRQALSMSNKGSQERLGVAESELQSLRLDAERLREQLKQFELLKFQQEREIGELKVQLAALKEQLVSREQLVTNQAAQIEQANCQRKSLEEMLTARKQEVQTLGEKFSLSVQEITKGNQIIQSLHASAKQAKAKLRIKASELAQQEKTIADLARTDELGKHALEEKDNGLLRAKDREERLQQDLEDMKKKLADAHEALRSNQDLIEYLNRQLTERDLKAIPPLVGGRGEAKEPRGSLAELLRRAENAAGGSPTPRGSSLGSTSLSPAAALGFGGSYGGFGSAGSAGLSPETPGLSSLAPGLDSTAFGKQVLRTLALAPPEGVLEPPVGSVGTREAGAAGSPARHDPLRGPVLYRSGAGAQRLAERGSAATP